ncbi:MAG: RNA 2',3'-cyclic phosphodiesterase [Candidatus Micrarchaeota archaeon]|nr:RNA 2',3'-cyclic phosphodiesterase [Candidatus Micrarchaeota archaeon]
MRVFLALELNEAAKERLAAIQTQIRQTGVLATYPNANELHATLAFYGERSPNQIRQMAEALAGIEHPAMELTLYGLGAFPKMEHIRVAWAGFSDGRKELIQLQQILADALGYRNDQPFHPHVTLARIKTAQHKDRLQAFLKKNEKTEIASFQADTLTLYESKLSAGGPAYVALETLELE